MMTDAQVHDAAERLHAAEASRTPIRQLSLQYPAMTIEDGYRVQRAWVDLKLAQGRTLYGHKIGLTSRAMQQASNITEPDYGALLDDMVFPEGSEIPAGRFIAPKVEVELAFRLARDLSGPDCTVLDVLDASAWVIPAIEIIDARIERIDRDTGVTRKVYDTISDNAANAGIVLGGRPVRPTDADLRWVGALLYRNGVIEETGVAAGVLNHPATGVAWLANRLYPHGVTLKAGQIVLAGSFTRPVDARPGDTFHADYGPLGGMALRFAP
ncbi:2-oxo-hept-3-ene-1,7-dioate hydratase [Deinococcus metalli]|uniref:2-oxo-hept-3-ene-1,7-dioate hydratase n=1 Tax=Deinococcus metalli TaxID=1141878 RepID=A0A7W8NRJ2_9DEIO|nr:2-oxo-hepta-3-ene-1,7-dioic acid hydratase [Deinococcus metalli]MBB5377945.1 2-oxo-hept-3-ene-1,7-dioate hydratase [Deinococcus metalli]GHF54941.1 2-oxo-hepta-3-ene-1,7-dioic acid hydratase [Deinococcus metalli]